MGDYVGVNLRAALSRIWCRCHGLFWWCPAARVAEPWVGMCRISSRYSRHRCSMLYFYFCDIWLCQYMQIILLYYHMPLSHMHSIDRIDTHTHIYIYIHTYTYMILCVHAHTQIYIYIYKHMHHHTSQDSCSNVLSAEVNVPCCWMRIEVPLWRLSRHSVQRGLRAWLAMVGDHGLSGYPFWYLLGKTLLLEIL